MDVFWKSGDVFLNDNQIMMSGNTNVEIIGQSATGKAIQPKVGLIILGAQKCATTTLYDILKLHPQICVSSRKETNFFVSSSDWRNDLHVYHSYFHPLPGQVLCEASPRYTQHAAFQRQIWDDLFAYNPEIKFIYLVRHPMDRIVSAYMHFYQRGYTALDIHEDLKMNLDYLTTTRYAMHITPYIYRFGRERVLIIDFDDFVKMQESVLEEIAHFSGIDYQLFPEVHAIHSNKTLNTIKIHRKWDHPNWLMRTIRRKLPDAWNFITKNRARVFTKRPVLYPAECQKILDELSDDIDQLEGLMGKSLKHWKFYREQ